jgi:hypothetical protein
LNTEKKITNHPIIFFFLCNCCINLFRDTLYKLKGDTTLSITIFSIMTLSIMTLSIMTLSILSLFVTLAINDNSTNDPQHNNTLH